MMAHDTTPADRVRREERDDRTPPAIPFAVGPRGLQALDTTAGRRRLVHGREVSLCGVPKHLHEELRLGAEMPIQRAGRDADPVGDGLD